MKIEILREILLNSFLLLVWLGSIASILLGLAMLVVPDAAARGNRWLSRWVDTYRFGVALDRPHTTERFLYRHHRVVGAAIAVGAIYVLNFFLFSNKARKMAESVSSDRFGVIDGVISVFVVGNVLAAAIGVVMALKPSLLRELEQSANRWVSTDSLQNFFNKTNHVLDDILLQYGKFSAVFFIAAGGFIFFRIGELLLNGTWRSLI